MNSICVFCSSSNSIDNAYFQAATDLGHRIGELGLELVYGGANIGLMGVVASATHEKGGRVVGVIPEFFRKKDKNIEYAEADELIVAETMSIRKTIMAERADAFLVLPGGVGTLEEATEILSMKQLGLTDKPLVFINTNKFYNDLISIFQKMINFGFAKPSNLELFYVCPDPLSAIQFALSYQPKKIAN
jgi:cytokinin riboside 5'-monophosphate phosphoribohydrolase